MATILVSTTGGTTNLITSTVPFQVYLQSFVAGCKVQFTDPNGDTSNDSVWQDLPEGEITQDTPIVSVAGGDDIVYRVLAPNTSIIAKQSTPQLILYR